MTNVARRYAGTQQVRGAGERFCNFFEIVCRSGHRRDCRRDVTYSGDPRFRLSGGDVYRRRERVCFGARLGGRIHHENNHCNSSG